MNIARLHQHFLLSSGVSTDTRQIKKDSIFFALKGDNFNGNTYAVEAINKGAKLAVVDEPEYALETEHFVLVKNCLKTLQELASFHRKYLNLPIIAITGSNGKTTTKELINAVLSKKYKALATKGNLNNHIGVPLTLLSMDEETEIGIVEMGASHPKEIEMLSEITQPDYGYITNFGKAHLEGFGSLEGVIKSKSELYDNLKKNKKLIFVNTDDEIQRVQCNYSHSFPFGTGRRSKVKLSYPAASPYAQVEFNETIFESKLTGKYNALNIAAAVSIGLYFKVPVKDIQEAIAEYTPQNNRSQIIEKNSNTILMDAYNANPTSMLAALENFSEMKTNKDKVVILGDMLEVGESSKVEHQAIVNYIANSNFAEAYLVGENFRATETSKPSTLKFKTKESLKDHLKQSKIENSNILIKGSRGIALEEILEVL